jgi:rhodanese-related sulfurtransferase
MARFAQALALAAALGGATLAAQALRNVERVSIDQLKAMMAAKSVVVIDVREPASFEKGRIPGAININYTDITRDAERFAGETRTIVTYCACTNETTAARAAVDLGARGVPGVKALRGGWEEWVSRGELVEK